MKWRSTIRFSRTRPGALRSRRRLAGAAVLALALALGVGCARKEQPGGAVGTGSVGAKAAAFELPDLNGKAVRLADFTGKVVILDFWATWCMPCRMEVPHFVRLQSQYKDQGLVIVGLSLDAGGARDVRPFVDENKVNYTMLIASDKTAESYGGIVGIPTTFVLDRNGRIVKRFIGYTTPEVLEETIRPLLGSTS